MNTLKNIRHELREQIQEWTVYGIIEGEQDFQTALDEAIDYLELNENELNLVNNVIVNESFVKRCYEIAADSQH